MTSVGGGSASLTPITLLAALSFAILATAGGLFYPRPFYFLPIIAGAIGSLLGQLLGTAVYQPSIVESRSDCLMIRLRGHDVTVRWDQVRRPLTGFGPFGYLMILTLAARSPEGIALTKLQGEVINAALPIHE